MVLHACALAGQAPPAPLLTALLDCLAMPARIQALKPREVGLKQNIRHCVVSSLFCYYNTITKCTVPYTKHGVINSSGK